MCEFFMHSEQEYIFLQNQNSLNMYKLFNESSRRYLIHCFNLFQVNSIAGEYNSALHLKNNLENSNFSRDTSDLEVRLAETLTKTCTLIMEAVQSICSLNADHTLFEESLGNISIWTNRFILNVETLHLNAICDDLINAIKVAVS